MNGIDPRKHLEHVLNLSNAMRHGDVSPISLLPNLLTAQAFKYLFWCGILEPCINITL